MGKKTLTLRISKELHKKLRMQLIQDEITFQDWVHNKIEEYVAEGEQE